MACPDRLKDARIVAEIERRKKILESQHSSSVNSMVLIINDTLYNAINMLGQDNIISIVKKDYNLWEITIESN
jgi:hypothetical protein